MKKLTSSLVAAAVALPFAASAEVTLFEDDRNKVSLSGYVDVRALNTQGKTELVDGTSRFRLSFERELAEKLTAIAVTEVGVNVVGNTEIAISGGDTVHTRNGEPFNLRLGYVGVTHEDYGTLTLGKQWGVFYDVSSATDLSFIYAGTASGVYTFNGDGGLNGTGRADKAIQYRNSFGKFSFGVQVQARNSSDEFHNNDPVPMPIEMNGQPSVLERIAYDNTFGLSATYQFTDKLSISAAHNQGKFEGNISGGQEIEAKDTITAVGFKYNTLYEDGLYFAANVNQNENHNVDNLGRLIPKSAGFEFLTAYSFGNGFTPMFTVNHLEADKSYEEQYNDGEFKRSFAIVGLHYDFAKDTILYVEARKDFSKMSEAQMKREDDAIGLGIRMKF